MTDSGAENPTETAAAVDPSGTEAVRDPEFDRIYETYVPLLRRIAVRKFEIPSGDIDQLVQDVFATYLTHAGRIRELGPYLIGGICNAARQYWRERDAQRPASCEADDALLEPLVRSTLMSAALSQLEPGCRETLRRFYLDGESAISIAASRGATVSSVYRLLSDGRSRAREVYLALVRS